MPETPEEFWERAKGALRTPPVAEWDTWPFDGALTPRALEPPVPEEPARHGEGGAECHGCAPTDVVWSDENWFVRALSEPSGLPVVVLLMTKRHVDFPDLDDKKWGTKNSVVRLGVDGMTVGTSKLPKLADELRSLIAKE